MALNLKGLAEDISNSVSALGGLFTNRTKNRPYPKNDVINPILSFIDGNEGNWARSLPYAFGVIADDNASGPNASINEFFDFVLPINPSEITQDENFATVIKPTQGGTVVQHSGNRYKDLTISGTTGVHPGRGVSGALQSTGQAILQPDGLRYKSGYEAFIALRNWFRAYYEHKRVHTEGVNLRLIFKNFKDGEFLIIELLKFQMKRSATRPFMYDYVITCKVLGHAPRQKSDAGDAFKLLEDIDNTFNTALEAIDFARGAFLRGQGILRQIESNVDQILNEPLRRIALALKAVIGTGNVAADMGPKIINEFNSQATALAVLTGIQTTQEQEKNAGTLDPRIAQIILPANLNETAKTSGLNFLLNQENDSLMALGIDDFPEESKERLAEDQSSQAEQPREFYDDIKADIIRVRDNAADRFGLGNVDYNAQFNRTATFSADPGKVVTDQEYDLLAGFNSAIRGIRIMLSTPTLFKSTYQTRISNVQEQFDDDLGLKAEPSVKELILPTNTDLEMIALNELGDSGRWVELAELNNLKPPYVVQDLTSTEEQVVKPGEKLLIPQPVFNGFGTITQNTKLAIDEGLSEVERNLGRDIRLSKDFDIEITNKGDFQLIQAAENAAQAIILKLSYEKGELFKHPEIGMGFQVGTKGPTMTDLQNEILKTLLQDPRFEDIKNLQAFREGDAIRLSFEVKIKNVDTPVPVDLKL